MPTTTNITDSIRETFDALRNPDYDNFCLFSCFVNGEPATAICVVNHDESDNTYTINPVFVSVTKGMALADHDGNVLEF